MEVYIRLLEELRQIKKPLPNVGGEPFYFSRYLRGVLANLLTSAKTYSNWSTVSRSSRASMLSSRVSFAFSMGGDSFLNFLVSVLGFHGNDKP